MKKVMLLIIASTCLFGILFGMQASRKQKPKQRDTTLEGDVGVIITSGVEFTDYYQYEPQKDITCYELATLIPLFTGVTYGHGPYGTATGRIVPLKDTSIPGTTVGSLLLSLAKYEVKRLGSAARHLRKVG